MTAVGAVIGIDIGGTTTSFGFVDAERGELLADAVIPTDPDQPAQTLVARLHENIESLLSSTGSEIQLRGIGIGAPNANYLRGTVENPPNLSWGGSVNLVKLFQKYYDLRVVITNDANAAALGEMYFGAAKEMKDFIVVTLGTGLGSGIVANGELVYGAGGFAGELGHTVVDPDGRACACGKQGCLETYVSATGLCRTAFQLMADRQEPSLLRSFSFNQLNSKMVCDAALEGDSIALAAFDATAKILGIKLADAVAHTAPEAIFLSGGLAAAGDLLLIPAKRYMEEYLFTPYKGGVKVLLSGIDGGKSAVMGAASLILHEMRS
ncbi:MAG: ROK family protein [Desulfuromonadaceae bacterium]|nr:ROK family protein [Desulfuromonadaceae bacterium]MDD2854404.1 ROK family protein [Desulfuromonadaceae bacterium]